MTNIHVGDGAAQERARYAEIWSREEYRNAHSPGMDNVDRFLRVLEPPRGSRIIDVGCGRGHAGLALAERGMDVWYLDITDAALDHRIDRARFISAAIWDDWADAQCWDYGFCVDVLEHIPPEFVMLSVDRVVKACTVSWLQICHLKDEFGPSLLGEPLHLTVHDHGWWMLRLATIGKITDARDLCGCGLYVMRER